MQRSNRPISGLLKIVNAFERVSAKNISEFKRTIDLFEKEMNQPSDVRRGGARKAASSRPATRAKASRSNRAKKSQRNITQLFGT